MFHYVKMVSAYSRTRIEVVIQTEIDPNEKIMKQTEAGVII